MPGTGDIRESAKLQEHKRMTVLRGWQRIRMKSSPCPDQLRLQMLTLILHTGPRTTPT